MFQKFIHLVFAASVMVFSASAGAQSMVDATNPADVLEIAKGYGSAELKRGSDGDPLIEGRLNGRSYAVFFYGCKGGRNCGSLQFYWGIDKKNVALSSINDWNQGKRFGRAYVDKNGELALEMDVNLRHGVSRKNLDDTFDFWRLTVTSFYSEFVE